MATFPFRTLNWNEIHKTEHPGESGTSFWQTIQEQGLRMRIVEYGPGYFADHWCEKGHFAHCLEGSFITEMKSGEKYLLEKEQSYLVSDELSSHRSFSDHGVKLLILDGDFLKKDK